MDGMSTPDLCWSCQDLFPEVPGLARDLVWLDADTRIPVCRECWNKIEVSERVKLAVMFRDRGPDGELVSDVLSWIRGCLSDSSLEGTPPSWLRRSDNIDN